jgi:hypothetical protein
MSMSGTTELLNRFCSCKRGRADGSAWPRQVTVSARRSCADARPAGARRPRADGPSGLRQGPYRWQFCGRLSRPATGDGTTTSQRLRYFCRAGGEGSTITPFLPARQRAAGAHNRAPGPRREIPNRGTHWLALALISMTACASPSFAGSLRVRIGQIRPPPRLIFLASCRRQPFCRSCPE